MPAPELAPVLLVGAGRMGGALLRGWLDAGAFAPGDLLILDPSPGEDARAAVARGAALDPGADRVSQARTVVLALKPQGWRASAEALSPQLPVEAVVVSVVAGVKLAQLQDAFVRSVARAMPNTAVAVGRGTVGFAASDERAGAVAGALFAPVASVAELPDESLMDAVTAVAGSGPAYLYAFVEAFAAAGASAGLSAEAASVMARSTVVGAAAMLDASAVSPEELRRQVTSPNGTTQAALDVLQPALATLMREAVRAAAERSKALGA